MFRRQADSHGTNPKGLQTSQAARGCAEIRENTRCVEKSISLPLLPGLAARLLTLLLDRLFTLPVDSARSVTAGRLPTGKLGTGWDGAGAAMPRGSDGLRLVSSMAEKAVREGLARMRPGLATARDWAHMLAARLKSLDLVPGLISAADHGERFARAFWQGMRRLAPRRGLGFAGALLWRSAAALAGLGLTAALITGLSAKDEDQPQLASLTIDRTPSELSRPTATRSDRPGPANWMAIPRPIAMFHLSSPELGRATPAYEAQRTEDGRREDVMTFAAFAEAGPHLVLRLRTGPLDMASARPFTIDLVREAALRSLSVGRSSAPAAIPTRFGPLETADVLLDDGSTSRNCLAFRSAGAEAGFAMSGWWCAGGKPADRRQLTCLIERLDLANAAGSEELRQSFAKSELKRDAACATPFLATAGRKASWLDTDGSVPALRMKTATTEPAKATPPARPVRPKATRRKR